MTDGTHELRLDRVERILEVLATTQQQTAAIARNALQIAESNAQSIEQVRQIAESNAQSIGQVRQIAESNARSIQAWEARIEENRVEADEERSELKVAIRELIRANQQNTIDHELFRRRFEAIDRPDNQDESEE